MYCSVASPSDRVLTFLPDVTRQEMRLLTQNLRHLVTFLEELQALGIAFVSLAEGIDATTPAGKLQMHILAAMQSSNEPVLLNVSALVSPA